MFFNDTLIALETSCDETSAAVLRGRSILSNVIASQIEMHQKWGGVVPEAAARAHVESLLPTIEEALKQARVTFDEIGAVAVTNRPGLVGALSVGVTAAKALALSNSVPLIGVHHLEGHLSSIFARGDSSPYDERGIAKELDIRELFPFVALVVSGGHTELVAVKGVGDYKLIGETIDDAAGEAFDKGARAMGLPYPGGRSIQEAAKTGNSRRYKLPQGLAHSKGSRHRFDFSFSGLKTAVLRLVELNETSLSVPDAAASLQEAIVGVLTKKSLAACEELGMETLAVVGGVAANLELRYRLGRECSRRGLRFLTPPIELCTDNAAMIGLAGSLRLARGDRDNLSMDIFANESIADLNSPTGTAVR